MGEPLRRLPNISGRVDQEIQTNLDSVTDLELIRDGTIPEHIAKVNPDFLLPINTCVDIRISYKLLKLSRIKLNFLHINLKR